VGAWVAWGGSEPIRLRESEMRLMLVGFQDLKSAVGDRSQENEAADSPAPNERRHRYYHPHDRLYQSLIYKTTTGS